MVPDGWELSGLGDVCEPRTGLQTGPFGSQLHASDYVQDGIPVVMPKDMINGGISTTSIARISPEKVSEVSKHKLKLGDIVFSRRGDLGRFAVVKSQNVGWICGTGCMRARLNGTVAPEFVFCQLITHGSVRWLEDNAVGQTMPNLNTEILSQLPLRFPPLPEQQKIAAILSTWDRAIELTEKLIAAKQKRKQALMQQLLTGKVRLPGFEKNAWKKCRLGDVAKNSTRRNGLTADQATVYSVTNSVGMIPMDEGVIGESIDRYKTVSRFDFAYNPMRINVGSIAMWDDDEDVLVSPDYVVYRCGPELNAEFLNHFRKTHYWRHFVNRAGGGSVRVRIYFSDRAAMKLNLPPVEEQKAIAVVLNAQDEEIRLLSCRLDALKQQKKGLMQQLLTGKVRVNVDAEMVKG